LIENLKLNEYSVKSEANIKYYESLTNKMHKDLFFDFLKNESRDIYLRIRLYDYYQDDISDENVVKHILAHIKILKIEYQRMPSPPILESEFIYFNLLNYSTFYRNEIGMYKKRTILSKDFINLRISVLNNMFSSQKKQIGVNLDVTNYLQKYFAENYEKFNPFGLESYRFFHRLIPYIILDRHDQETRNKIEKDFTRKLFLSIDEDNFTSAIKDLDLPLFIKNNKIIMAK